VPTDAEARAAVASLPWVARSPLNWGHRCTALHTRAPREASWNPDNTRRQDLPEKHRCRKTARWVLFDTEGRIRTFCWWHLWHWMHQPGEELDRFNAYTAQWDLQNYSPELDPEDLEIPG
jgi:hypothetical protein